MQAKPPSKKQKVIKYLDTKILLGTLSAAVTIGLWNMFSSSALQQEKKPAEDISQPPQAFGEEVGLPALPTLIPLLDVSGLQTEVMNVQVQTGPAPALRSVLAPTQVVVQKIKPVIDSAVVISNDDGGGGGGGGNQQPAATTRSSR
jgi:hypothetical protein